MSIVVVLDCGATNIRAIAVSESGHILGSHYIKNNTKPCASHPDHHIWDFDEIWQKMVTCCQRVVAAIDVADIVGITVTTFGVDGAPFDEQGQQIYPIISWKCPRTAPVMGLVETELDRLALFNENGVGNYSFNTLYKLRWLSDNEPDIYQSMDKFVFISSMVSQKLTGQFTSDRTMAGTSMLTDLASGEWHLNTLDYLGLSDEQFPPLVNAGEKTGELVKAAADELGLPTGLPVISAGHDTQFALIGSGAEQNQAFLSSGTWEILMARCAKPELDQVALDHGLSVELDAIPGLYNPAIQWLSSAVVEWAINQFYAAEKLNPDLYDIVVSEARRAQPGAVRFEPTFTVNSDGNAQGVIEGLSIDTTRGEIMRAVFDSLSEQLKHNFAFLSQRCQLDDQPLIVVGGGARNTLWNQLRADALQRPLLIVDQAEATVMGAAMVAFWGVGQFETLEQAQTAMQSARTRVDPNKDISHQERPITNKEIQHA